MEHAKSFEIFTNESDVKTVHCAVQENEPG